MDGNKLALIAELMDKFMLKQNALLILENSDLDRDIVENENTIMSLRQASEIHEEYTDQVIAENTVLMEQLNRLRLDYNELMHDFNRQVERNIRLERQIQRLQTGDSLFFHTDSESDFEQEGLEDCRRVRRKLQFDL